MVGGPDSSGVPSRGDSEVRARNSQAAARFLAHAQRQGHRRGRHAAAVLRSMLRCDGLDWRWQACGQARQGPCCLHSPPKSLHTFFAICGPMTMHITKFNPQGAQKKTNWNATLNHG